MRDNDDEVNGCLTFQPPCIQRESASFILHIISCASIDAECSYPLRPGNDENSEERCLAVSVTSLQRATMQADNPRKEWIVSLVTSLLAPNSVERHHAECDLRTMECETPTEIFPVYLSLIHDESCGIEVWSGHLGGVVVGQRLTHVLPCRCETARVV